MAALPGSNLGPDLFIEELMLLTSQNLDTINISDHYQVVKDLGSGTYGKVQLVTHRFRGTTMALKLMRKGKTTKRSFLREYSLSLYLCSNPLFVNIFGIAFQTDDYYGFIQEFAPIGDLYSIIKPQVGIGEAASKRCALQLSMALQYLHSKDLVHRDVKLENVLVFDGDCRQVKLCDFGLVRRVGLLVKHPPTSSPYSPPELSTQDAQKVGVKVSNMEDVWAFGVVLYGVLTGYFPWETSQDACQLSVSQWVAKEPGCQVPSQWRGFSRPALEMFSHLLAPQPNHRCHLNKVLSFLASVWLGSAVGARGAVGRGGGVGPRKPGPLPRPRLCARGTGNPSSLTPCPGKGAKACKTQPRLR